MKPIWVVDDDQSIRFVLEKALAREQFAVRSFASPREVLKAMEDDAPQVLVSDIRMPGLDGPGGEPTLDDLDDDLPGLDPAPAEGGGEDGEDDDAPAPALDDDADELDELDGL